MRINSDSREVYHGDAPKSDRKELPATVGKLVAETELRIVFSGKLLSASLRHLGGRGFLDSALNLYVSLRLPPWR
ncbi:MAG: hypothetical protein DME87_09305 [Verrucomicrobia bacterium]|nr:MAG: hypothetical protein DME87_09305 [Verrucomicrobiota bacterium]